MHHFRLTCLLLLAIWLLPACEFRPAGGDPTPTAVSTPFLSTSQSSAIPPSPPATPLPPLPTAPATAVPQPTPTYNPLIADWTLLIYMAADNSLAAQAQNDLAEMITAGENSAVNVIVQLDQPESGAVRYRLPDTAPLAEFNSLNMGSAQTLGDFLIWGLQTFPANRTALIFWNHGAGWEGTAFDEGEPVQDSLTLPELQTALAQAAAHANLPSFDLIAFDACLMAQLEVFQAVQPFARYAAGSAELAPSHGWEYRSLLAALYANPRQDGAALAQALVRNFAAAYADEPFVTMTAVDLSRLPALTFATETLAAALMADPEFTAAAVSEGRSGAISFARAFATGEDRYAATDLGQFAAILSRRSPDALVQQSARQVQDALETTILAHHAGAGLNRSSGMAIYFPRSTAQYDPEYGRSTPLTQWDRFLGSYHRTGEEQHAAAPPEVHLTNLLRESAGLQNPAYLEFEVIGRGIADVLLLGGLYEADGRRRLLEYDRLIPEPTYLADGSRLDTWRDGLHEDFFIWDTQITYMYDSSGSGGFVVMWPTNPGSSHFSVQGQYRSPEAESWIPASLLFDHRTGHMARMWGQQIGGAVELIPAPRGEFQVFDFHLAPDNSITQQPGGSLVFDDTGLLYFDWRPLPDGSYYLGFAVENGGGKRSFAFTDLSVQNSANLPGYAAYLDPYLGFQFLYPESWHTPVYTQGLLYAADPVGEFFLQVTVYPNAGRAATANALQEEALRQFGAVDVLFVDEAIIAGVRGLRTAYGYERTDGAARTGLLLTFVQSGVGYVIDMDGPLERESETISAVATLIASWQFGGAAFGVQPGQWTRRTLDSFSVAQPADFIYQPTNTWQRFSANRETFLALRARPATGDLTTVLAHLVRDAGSGVANFIAQEPRRFALGNIPWQRADFSYTNGDGREIWGFVMVKLDGGQEVVAWAEAPKATYNELETGVFLLMIADLTLGE